MHNRVPQLEVVLRQAMPIELPRVIHPLKNERAHLLITFLDARSLPHLAATKPIGNDGQEFDVGSGELRLPKSIGWEQFDLQLPIIAVEAESNLRSRFLQQWAKDLFRRRR